MDKYTAVIVGATGLIGHHLLQILLEDERFERVKSLGRRKPAISHQKLESHIVDFQSPEDLRLIMGAGDIIFSCVGTTQKKVKGDRQLYRQVDFDIPVNVARAGIENGFKKFLLVSSVGATAGAKNFYLSLKGETEDAVSKLSFDEVHIFRPSILVGRREEARPGEEATAKVLTFFAKLLIGSFKKFRPIKATEVARAMTEASTKGVRGIHIYMYEQIKKLSQENRVLD